MKSLFSHNALVTLAHRIPSYSLFRKDRSDFAPFPGGYALMISFSNAHGRIRALSRFSHRYVNLQ